MEVIKNKLDKDKPIKIIGEEQFALSKKLMRETPSFVTPQKKSEDSLFLDLNSDLVKFWKENNIQDKEVKIRMLERMLNWYRNMGTITMD